MGTDVEKICRFIQKQHVWFVKEKCCQFDPGLPSARKRLDQTVEFVTDKRKLSRHFTATPVRLPAITDEKIEHTLIGLKWIVLPQVAETQIWMADHFSSIEFLLPGQCADQGRFACTIEADHANFAILRKGNRRAVEQ